MNRFVICFVAVATLVAVATASGSKQSAIHIPDSVRKILDAAEAARRLPSRGNGTQKSSTAAFPQSVQFLLNMFEKGSGFPRSFNDVLPDGSSYWATAAYLEAGALDLANDHIHLDALPAVEERTLVRYGLFIHDAAVWEIALSLHGLHDVAYVYENEILYTASTGAGPSAGSSGPSGICNLRADGAPFRYRGVNASGLGQITYPGNVTHFPCLNGEAGAPTKHGPGSYFYRLMVPHYLLEDPMVGRFGNDWKVPWPNYDPGAAWDVYGAVTMNDWKPMTGENVWAAILGPLQALGIANNNQLNNTVCGNYFRNPTISCTWETFETTPPAMQLAISVLPALLGLQTSAGAIYYVPEGTDVVPADPNVGQLVLNRDNLVALAAVTIADDLLMNYTNGTSDPTLEWARMSFGSLRRGLEKWFNNRFVFSQSGQLPSGWLAMVQGGYLNTSGFFPISPTTMRGFDVEAQLLAMTLLPNLDTTYGSGFARQLWLLVKSYCGVYQGSILRGIGATSQLPPSSQTNLWNSEWTFEAINAAQVLAQRYQAEGKAEWAADLLADAQSMYNSVTALFPTGLRFPDGSYAQSNNRFLAPAHGWYVNPLSSLSATSWSVLQEKNCDPFHWNCGSKPALNPPPSTFAGELKETVSDALKHLKDRLGSLLG